VLSPKPRIVVIGAGFAGLRAIRKLAGIHAEIILIDRNNYHTFIPLLYQVATGFIAPEIITYPLRKYLRSLKNARFIQAEVRRIDLTSRLLYLSSVESATTSTIEQTEAIDFTYDYLIIATGSKTKFLGVEGAAEYSLPMRTLEDAVRIRDRIICNFERATVCNDIDLKRQLLTIVIVGGGPTGVELAGAIIELVKGTLDRDYRNISPQEVRIVLIHSGDKLLGYFPSHLSDYTSKQLRRRGIKVHLSSRVGKVTPQGVELEDGTTLETATVIWTAGVEADYPTAGGKIPTASKEKIQVNGALQLPDYPEVYAVGDVALVKQDGDPLLGIAPEALQQGGTVAKNLRRQLKGLPPKPFNYFDKGTAAIIARNSGVALLLGRIPLGGFFAWLLWLGIHVYYLPGIANRFTILGSWLRDYLTGERNERQLFDRASIAQLGVAKSDRYK
jgi:NADH dehydrogenase